MDCSAGYLIVKTYARLYRDYVQRYSLTKAVYAIPRIDRQPESYPIQYRGLDRDALDPYPNSDDLAEIRMWELLRTYEALGYYWGFLYTEEEVEDVLSFASSPTDYETIWARVVSSGIPAPAGFSSAGYEATYFDGDHFSASCDCMLIPRWHGSDEDGTLFLEYFRQLNRHGLFTSPEVAQRFLAFYLSFDWTEGGNDPKGADDYEIAEVFLKNV
jgi:hypothetical protein